MQTPTEHTFCTGSSYSGQLDNEGKMTGFGTYRYPNGTEYQGHFKNGVFHGHGMIIHPTKFKMCGYFINRKCKSYATFFPDGLEYKEVDWQYCTASDRRFWLEVVQGISPVGEQFSTKDKLARFVPRGLYDAEEGFFNPKTGYIHDAVNGERIRYVCPDERDVILRNYRMNSIDFKEQEEARGNNINCDISTDLCVSSDEE